VKVQLNEEEPELGCMSGLDTSTFVFSVFPISEKGVFAPVFEQGTDPFWFVEKDHTAKAVRAMTRIALVIVLPSLPLYKRRNCLLGT